MTTSKRTLSRALSLAFLTALLPAATASAQPTPQDLVEQCVTAIAHTTQHTVRAVRTKGAEGVHHINTLDDNDAPVPVMIRTAQMTNNAIERIAFYGARNVSEIAGRCLHILANIEADPALAGIIVDARMQALRAIRATAIHSRMNIRNALETALEDEEEPAVAGGVNPLDPASPL